MHKSRWALIVSLALAVMLCGAVTGLAAENLVQNPYMDIDEDGDGLPDNWQADWGWLNDGVLSMDTEVTHGGDASLKVVDGNYSWGGRVFQDIPVEPGKSYKFSGWVKGEKFGGAAWYRFYWHYSDDSWSNAWDIFEGISGTFDWTEQTDVIEVPEGVQELRIMAFATPGYGTLWYSDVSLVEAAGGAAGAVDTAMIEDIARKVAKEVVEENAGPARPGAVEFSGSLESELTLTPENFILGHMKYTMNGWIRAIPHTKFRLGWYGNRYLYFWDQSSYDNNTFNLAVNDVSIELDGALWDDGSPVKLTLGDYIINTPNYIVGTGAGKPDTKGVRVQGLQIGEATVDAFFGWPRYSSYNRGKTGYRVGANATMELGNLSLSGHLFSRLDHEQAPASVTIGDITREFDGVNRGRGVDELILYTPAYGDNTGTNYWGHEVVIEDGKVKEIILSNWDGGPQSAPIPDNGFVISGNGEACLWIQGLVEQGIIYEGAEVTITAPTTPWHSTSAETVVSLEGTQTLPFGSISATLAHQFNFDEASPYGNAIKVDGEFNLNEAVDQLADSLPLTLTAGFRKIDDEFQPSLRETDTTKNYLEKQRNATGYDVGLTAVIPTDVADVTATLAYDWFKRGDNTKSTPSVNLSTEVQGYALSAGYTTYKIGDVWNEDYAEYTAGVEKTFDVPLSFVGDLTVDYDVTYVDQTKHNIPEQTEKLTNELELSTRIDLPFFKGITITNAYKFETVNSESNREITLGFTYAVPNGLSLEGKHTWPVDTYGTSDAYLKLGYKLSF